MLKFPQCSKCCCDISTLPYSLMSLIFIFTYRLNSSQAPFRKTDSLPFDLTCVGQGSQRSTSMIILLQLDRHAQSRLMSIFVFGIMHQARNHAH